MARPNDLMIWLDALRGFRPQCDRKARGGASHVGHARPIPVRENPIGNWYVAPEAAAAAVIAERGPGGRLELQSAVSVAAQLPPDSHCATASQFGLGPAWATAVESDMDAVSPAMADLMGFTILVMLDISPEAAEALPIVREW